ncbi:MAG: YcjF family protein [Leptolyngbyaceae cyanobacterium]
MAASAPKSDLPQNHRWLSSWQAIRSGQPLEQITQRVIKWFAIDDEQMADILTRIRAQLPTTEAWLIGKPQSGKSSIVRGLTGVSADIIGQGFRPHTQHTERYAYPSVDLPLLLFTDTVGLGDVDRDVTTIIQELQEDLAQQARGARILLVTVKINDFAVDSLHQILQQVRTQHPTIPVVLIVTCLHELYASEEEHSPYPPIQTAVQRAFGELKRSFDGLYDSAVMVDFTLEEDGYTPVFYGLEALLSVLSGQLPEAESNAIYQLLDQTDDATTQLGAIYRDVARRYISAFAVIAATLAAVPLPFATMPAITALQVSMIVALGQLYGQRLSVSQAGGVASTIAGGFLAQAVGRELIKLIPGFGSVIAASWAAAYTWALGEGACVYFGDLMGGKKPDPERIQAVMKEAFEAAKERFTQKADR